MKRFSFSKKMGLVFLLLGLGIPAIQAQSTTSASNYFTAQAIPDRSVLFNLSDAGVSKPMTWGLDLAWLSETNIRRGIAFMGADRVDIVRASFQPTYPLLNGDLQTAQITDLNTRLNLIDLTGTKTQVVLNCDHPSVDASYLGNAANWAALIDSTTKRVQARGRIVISVSPFNEPDYGWGQYTGTNGQSDFLNICTELRKNTRFDNIRICGGNTLNNDKALSWYNYLKDKLEEGNTHQLAGTFDNFATFYTTVKANGDIGTGDELHNVMEAMVGSEYGMQTGIWWGTAEYARGELVKATDGVRLGYAEHRPNWTAAAVYRNLEGKVQAFGGTSERQGLTTTYRFVSKDRDVYFDGYGPQREYLLTMPGGTGYQNGQTNAEKVVNITWGDDIQPVINGRYLIVNRNSGKVLEVAAGSVLSGANIQQNTPTGASYQQWTVSPVSSRIGGDFSYFTILNVNSNKSPDVLNYSLDNGASVIQYDDAKGTNQQWYLEYAEEGWFYIRNRQSAKCLQITSASTADGAGLQQWEKNSSNQQQWRFLPVDANVEFVSPAAPSLLVATANAESVQLDWFASTDLDVTGYDIFRSESAGGTYTTIARNINAISFIDNTVTTTGTYFYKIKAVDKSLNRSVFSNEVSASTTGNKEIVCYLQFEETLQDSTHNLNHGASYGGISYQEGKIGKALAFNGTNSFLQLPTTVANQEEITISMWVYWNGGATWQRIFDFGNDQNQYLFLTPNSGTGLRFGIKNGGTEQNLDASILPTNTWSHVAVTLGTSGASLYVNGELVAENATLTSSPFDFRPVLNYIGRSPFSDPLFNGSIDDFRIYNYALSAKELGQAAGFIPLDPPIDVDVKDNTLNHLSIYPSPANTVVYVNYSGENTRNLSHIEVFDAQGNSVISKELKSSPFALNLAHLASGTYLLKLSNSKESLVKKLIIKH